MYPSHAKDIALGLFGMYVVVDILLSFSPNTKHTSVFSTIFNHFSDRDIGIILVIGMVFGLFVYYFARKSREHFTAVVLGKKIEPLF